MKSKVRWIMISAVALLLLLPVHALSQERTKSAPQVLGTDGAPANQDIFVAPRVMESQRISSSSSDALGSGSTVEIRPASPTRVSNCIPFGNNTFFGYTGFIYRDVPPFVLSPGNMIRFDLGAQNNQPTRRNIYFAVANKNPSPAVIEGNNVASQGVRALNWVKVVSDTQTPLNSLGNFVKDDYELAYTAEQSFSFPGGGFIVGVGGSPPGDYADGDCDQVLVVTDSADANGRFYSRFFFKPDQTLEVLDDITGGGSAVELGGIIIEANDPCANDTEGPMITGASASPSSLGPPNHRMVDVTVNYSVTDNCDPASLITTTLSVTSNESVNGRGDGNTTSDAEVVDAHRVRLRAERSGTGSGRIYTIIITATDSKGNSSSQNVTVSVPHDRR